VSRTDELIASLAAGLQPVQRMRPPNRRALSWLSVTLLVVAMALAWFASMDVMRQRLGVTRIALESIGSALTAITAVLAAFELSVPDHSRRWVWLPVLPLLLWMSASGAGCLQNGLGLHSPFAHHTPSCFAFIIAVSVPLSVGLFWMLRRAHPIAPLPVAAFGTLGVAAMSATVLQFFHPFDITWLDLGFHLAAVLVVMGVGAALRNWLLATR
jgi:hypothetical protein